MARLQQRLISDKKIAARECPIFIAARAESQATSFGRLFGEKRQKRGTHLTASLRPPMRGKSLTYRRRDH